MSASRQLAAGCCVRCATVQTGRNPVWRHTRTMTILGLVFFFLMSSLARVTLEGFPQNKLSRRVFGGGVFITLSWTVADIRGRVVRWCPFLLLIHFMMNLPLLWGGRQVTCWHDRLHHTGTGWEERGDEMCCDWWRLGTAVCLQIGRTAMHLKQ